MERILHLSDFHMTFNQVDSVKKLDNMVEFLNKNDLRITHIVFTGDAIDQATIKDRINNDIKDNKINDSDEDKKRLRHMLMKDAFDNASRILRKISRELGVSPERIIIACGNHDVHDLGNAINKGNCSVSNNSEEEMKHDFALFEEFAVSITNRKGNFYTDVYSIDGFNFLILNSNYVNKNQTKEKKCINCYQVLGTITKHKKKLTDSCEKNSFRNIVVAHAPKDAFCENARFEYLSNNLQPLMRKIDETFGLFLGGDKHTNIKENNMYLAGQPLVEDYLSYNIIEFSDYIQGYIWKKIECRESQWNLFRSQESIQEILNISFSYLNNRVFKTFEWNKNIEIVSQKIVNNNLNWIALNNLFKCIVTLKKTIIEQPGNTYTLSDNIFDQISTIITTSSNSNPITLRGPTKLGKSTFLSFYYIYLLNKYIMGLYDYLPVYINIEELFIKTESNFEIFEKELKLIIDKIKELGQKYSAALLVIIDGVSHYKYYHYDYTESLIRYCNSFYKHDRIIYSIDKEENLKFSNSKLGDLRSSEYLLYFDTINLIADNYEKYENFITAYKAVIDNDFDKEEFTQLIQSLRLPSIDLDLVIHISELKNKSGIIGLTSGYSNYYDKKIKNEDMKLIAPKAAYLLKYGSYILSFEQLKEETGIDVETFKIIKDQRYMNSFLVAEYYINNVLKYLDKSGTIDNRVLDTLFTKNDTMFILDYIKYRNLKDTFVSFFNEFIRKKPNYKGLSSAIYFLGRISVDKEILGKLLDRVDKYLAKNKDTSIIKLNVYRSYIISKIASYPNNLSVKEHYLKQLFGDATSRELNRAFHRYFYGDIAKNELSLKDTIGDGFDFYHTYHNLTMNIDKYIRSFNKYSLLEIDLFTLCNLIQTRLGKKNALNQNYFFSKKYPDSKDVLKKVVDYLNTYLVREKNEGFPFLLDYFKVFRDDVNCFLENGSIFNPSEMMNETMLLFNVDRMGWRIKEIIGVLSDEMITTLGSSHEKITEHILATYYIGLFYLPTKLDNKPDYCKQKVLNAILIHDIGEGIAGDYPSFYENYEQVKLKEDKYNRKFFSRSTYEFIADDLLDCYCLWDSWKTKDKDINTVIAQDLDKLQLLYKYYCIICDNFDEFTNERKCSFLSVFDSIKSDIVKQIYKTLIEENPVFKDLIGNEFK